MCVKNMILSIGKNEPVPITFARCRLGCVTGGDKPKTPDRLSSIMEADGGDRINVLRQELYVVNSKLKQYVRWV